MDFLTMVLCICIGNAVAWLIALYTERGMQALIWNTFFGIVGATLGALVIAWAAPVLGVVGVLAVGPATAALAISAGQRALRSLLP